MFYGKSLLWLKATFWAGMRGLSCFCGFVLRILLWCPPVPPPAVDFTYPSLEEPAPVLPVVAENEEMGDNLEERLKSLKRPNIQDAAVPKYDSSFVVNPMSVTRSIPEVSFLFLSFS